MECPQCVYGMYWRNAKHSSVEDIKAALPWFSGITRISLTGGEPTMHPRFMEIAHLVRQMLPGILLSVETNATLYPRFKPALELFDGIEATHYTANAWPGCPDNSDKINALKSDFPKTRILEAKHRTMDDNRGSNMCGRQARAHWSHGLIYGCCAATGLRKAIGIPPQEEWHQKLKAEILPCGDCVFGQP